MAIRCFIAAEVPEAVKKSLGEIILTLRKSGADVKWVAPQNIHITLKFLGSIDEELIGPIKEALSRKVARYAPFHIRIYDIGCFPDERRPRVVWVGVEDPGELQSLYKDIDAEMAGFGFPVETRPFSPHLTIGRVRSNKRVTEMLRLFEEFRSVSFDVGIEGISLMKSELKPAGAEYQSLAEILFKGRKDVD